jgi:hypothetical protein
MQKEFQVIDTIIKWWNDGVFDVVLACILIAGALSAIAIVLWALGWAALNVLGYAARYLNKLGRGLQMRKRERMKKELMSAFADVIGDVIDSSLAKGEITEKKARALYSWFARSMNITDFLPQRNFNAPLPHVIDLKEDILARLSPESREIFLSKKKATIEKVVGQPTVEVTVLSAEGAELERLLFGVKPDTLAKA